MFTPQSFVFLSSTILVSSFANGSGLGPADGFTIFTIESYQANNTDCTGRVAVGGPATYNNFGVGSGLSNSNGTRDDLIVAGNLTWNNGQNFNGNIQAAGPTTLLNVGYPNGTVGDSVSIDFDDAEIELQELSDDLFLATANGSVSNSWGQLSMVGTDSELNVFFLTQSDLNPLWGMSITVPQGSTVLVNVDHQTMQLNNFQPTLNGCDETSVLWNFPDSVSIQMNSIGWKGTILAPNASIQFNNGQIDGALVCRLIQGNGESHHAPFDGDLPTDDDEYEDNDIDDACSCCCHQSDDDDDEDSDGDDECDDVNSDGDDDDDDEDSDDDDDEDDDDDDEESDDDDDCECDCDCNIPSPELIYD
ncbi:MAG: choice-of-anchor A family protein [Planctomycetes bacterium]|nr:choice-of-anchor A family protein [Planctomycetota bacterium]